MCLFSLLVLPAPFAAQSGADATARKVDTYDDKIGGSEAEQWRLESFREQLLKGPRSRAFIVAYNGREDPPGRARRYALRAKNYLVEARGIDPRRVVTVEGGRREDFGVELWLVPAGASAPEVTATIAEPSDPGDNLLYDAYGPGYDNFASYEGAEARLDGFAEALKKEPKAWGCVVAYAQGGDDRMGLEWDSPGTAREMALGAKNYLVRERGLAPSRVSAVDGGYSEGRSVELWIMRPKARFDKGPFVYPHRLKAGRGGTMTIDNRNTTGACCRACARGAAKHERRGSRTRR